MSNDSRNKRSRRTRRGRRGKLEELIGSARPSGLDPVDILTSLSGEQRKLVNWLAKRKGASVGAIAAGIGQPPRTAAEILSTLKSSDYVRESLRDGELTYRIVFGGRSSSPLRGLPEEIWARIDSNRAQFLRELPMFASLAESEVEELATRMRVRRHERDDVILWQGQVVDNIYLIKSGVAGISIIQNDIEERATYVDYAQQGDMFGEYSLLAERDHTASATVTALSAVELLYMPHDEFRQVMHRYAGVSFGVAQTLVHRLMDQLSQRDAGERHVLLVFGSVAHQLIVGSALAGMLARDKSTVFSMFPDPREVASAYGLTDRGLASDGPVFHTTPLGYDVAVLDLQPGLPLSVRVTLAMQQLVNRYSTFVVGFPMRMSSAITYALEQAEQVIVVCEPGQPAWGDAQQLLRRIRPLVPPERTALFTMLLRTDAAHDEFSPPGRVDFDVSYTSPLRDALSCRDLSRLPEPLVTATELLADRLGRTNQIGIYIPTTIDVDQPIDTASYAEATLEFLGELFGGATSARAKGVWNSEDAGLVDETVYIVRSFATSTALKANLPRVLSYVEAMKEQLKQEAMAVEVNQKLMLL